LPHIFSPKHRDKQFGGVGWFWDRFDQPQLSRIKSGTDVISNRKQSNEFEPTDNSTPVLRLFDRCDGNPANCH
jgi:hypothetical protein